MKLKDFLETDDFYTLTNNAKLLYLYLNAYKDKDNLVYCSELIMMILKIDSRPFAELRELGWIKIDEDSGIINVTKEWEG
ncbi:septum site-determining protein MinC [Limosilactobacillus sp. c9Ua_26_M]|uniref:Septum site-determining protein MinC n=1 Tax=Limosilactobacillus urinaemulieris TaxID=2742600 RepID=A0ABR8ZJF1_9LACO|nr:septum site-determining protein MinC [Limosilactobacillus urinaemulieris]MBD8085419.1 septum site-determining protein MinC [Limosilactobacillus urinaemulieris]